MNELASELTSFDVKLSNLQRGKDNFKILYTGNLSLTHWST